MAATAFIWIASAMRSWASRQILKSVATFSAVSGIESTPYCAFISLLTKRQPMVVSYTALLRLKALSALGMTKHARPMLSPALEGARRGPDGIEPRATQAVDGAARNLQRQARQQAAHAGDVAVVFAGLVGAAKQHIGHGGPVNLRVARHQRAQGNGAEVVGAHRAEGTAIAAERCADRVANKGLVHGFVGRLRLSVGSEGRSALPVGRAPVRPPCRSASDRRVCTRASPDRSRCV